VEIIFAIQIDSELLNIIVIIIFQKFQKKNFVVLKAIKFFNNLDSVKEFLDKHNIDLISNIPKTQKFDKIRKLEKIMIAYLNGKQINPYQQIVELGIKIPYKETFETPFSRRVIQWIIKNLSYGKIISYSEIGKNIESKAYQAIGNVMRKNPFPLVIPCHRVIKKDGDVGGFMGKMEGSWQENLKKELLNMEKINILKNKN